MLTLTIPTAVMMFLMILTFVMPLQTIFWLNLYTYIYYLCPPDDDHDR